MTDITLLKGDCLEIMATLPPQSIDAIICDLPFGTTNCDWDSPIPLERLWGAYERVVKPGAPIVLFGAQPFTSCLISSRYDLYRAHWYWEKEKGTNFFKTGQQPLRVIEDICVFSFEKTYRYNPQLVPLDKPYRHTMPLQHSAVTGKGYINANNTPESREYKTYTHSQPKNILKFARDKGNRGVIPTQKPIALMEYLVQTYSNPGDVVLDNTMGSGTTGVACRRQGRKFIGIEVNDKHFDYAHDRIHLDL